MVRVFLVLGGVVALGCGGDGTGAPRPCGSPLTDADTGLVICAEGYLHRASAKTCAAADPAVSALPRAAGEDCSSDGAACQAFAYGRCLRQFGPGGMTTGVCVSGCASDDDCDTNSVCVCGAEGSAVPGICRPSDCRSDSDCGDGQLCASSDAPAKLSGDGGDVCDRYVGFACQRAEDECETDEECPEGHCEVQTSFDEKGKVRARHRVCASACSI